MKLAKDFVADHDLSLELKYEQQFAPHVIIEKGDAQKGTSHIAESIESQFLSSFYIRVTFLNLSNEMLHSTHHEASCFFHSPDGATSGAS